MPFVTARKNFDLKPLGDGLVRTQGDLVYWDGKRRLMITVPDGFECDLASYPHLARPFFDRLGDSMRPAVLHDWLYKRQGKVSNLSLSKAEADRILREALLDEGSGWLSRWATWTGVAVGGWWAWFS